MDVPRTPAGSIDRSHMYRIADAAPENNNGDEVNLALPDDHAAQQMEAPQPSNIDPRTFSNADVRELRVQTSYDMRQRSEDENDNLSRSVDSPANSQPGQPNVIEMGMPDAPDDPNHLVAVVIVSNSSFFSSLVRTCGNRLSALLECMRPPLSAVTRFFNDLFGRPSGSDYAPQPSPRDETRDIRAQRPRPTEMVIVQRRPVEPRPDSPGPQPILSADDDTAFKPISIPK